MQITIYPPHTSIIGHIFNIPIRYYGVIMAFSLVFGIIFCYRLFLYKKRKHDGELFIDYIPNVILTGLFGARLFYIIGAYQFYIENPKEIIMINHGGLSIFGAIFFSIGAIYYYSKKKKFNFLYHLDIIALSMPICQSIGRIGNYFNQEAYGRATDGFLRLYVDIIYRPSESINQAYYHPAFLYEIFFNFIIFIVLYTMFLKSKSIKSGTIALLYLILYSIIRLIVEYIRIDYVLALNNVSCASIIASIVLVFSTIALFLIYKK